MAAIAIDHDKCNQDGICVAECPAQVLRMEPKTDFPVPTDDFDEACIRCGHCVAVCPTGAFGLDWMPVHACVTIEPELRLSSGQAEQFLRSRRSIRVFRDEPVDRAKLEKLIEIACYAPSAKNAQPWQWIVIEAPEKVRELDARIVDWMRSEIQTHPDRAAAMRLPRIVELWERGQYKTLRNAPHLFIVHVDAQWQFGVEDTALALSYAELFAPVLGLGATWSGYFYRACNSHPPMAQAVPVPAGRKVVGAMMVGRPKFKYQRLPNRNPPRIEWR